MTIVMPWLLLMMLETYRYGIKPGTMPEPYHYLMGSVAMVFAGIVAQFNSRVGGLLAWGLLLGAIIATASAPKESGISQMWSGADALAEAARKAQQGTSK